MRTELKIIDEVNRKYSASQLIVWCRQTLAHVMACAWRHQAITQANVDFSSMCSVAFI